MENDVQHWDAFAVKEIEDEVKRQDARLAVLEQTIRKMGEQRQQTHQDMQIAALALQKAIKGPQP